MQCPACHAEITPTEVNSAIMYDKCYFLCRGCFHILHWVGNGLIILGDNELLYLEQNDPHQLRDIVEAICGHMRRVANQRPTRPLR